MFDFLDDFLEYVTLFIFLINVVVYFKSCRNIKSTAFNLYLLSTFIILLISNFLAFYRVGNLFLSHFYFLSQFILLSLFYRKLFVNSLQKILVDIVLCVVISSVGFQYIVQSDLFFTFNIFEVFVCSLPLVIYAIIHLYNSLTNKGVFMYINAGILIYLSTSTLIFILGNFIASINSGLAQSIWFINKGLYVVYLLLIFIEWYKNHRIIKRDLIHIK